MKFSLQIIDGYRLQKVPSIVLTLGLQKYIFNIPETTQRFIREQGVKFTPGSKIFLTQLSTQYISGMYGILLTFFENKVAFGIKMYGPPGLCNYINGIRFLMGYRLIPYGIYDFGKNLKGKDMELENLIHANDKYGMVNEKEIIYNNKLLGVNNPETLEKILLDPDYNLIFYNMNEYLKREQAKNKDVINDPETLIDQKTGIFKDDNLEIIPILLRANKPNSKITCCYICKSKKFQGKVDSEKLNSLKLPKKKIPELMKQGKVEHEGIIYTIDQVQDPVPPSSIIIISDCPDKDHIQSLINNTKFNHLYHNTIDPKEETVDIIVHLGPPDVILDLSYMEWMTKFPKNTHHIFLDPNFVDSKTLNKEKGMEKQVKIDSDEFKHIQINNVVNKIFPELFPYIEKNQPINGIEIKEAFKGLINKSIQQRFYEFMTFPLKMYGWQLSAIKSAYENKHERLENIINVPKWKKIFAQINSHSEINTADYEKSKILFGESNPEMVLLGTGSMMPSQYRNVSSIYLRFWQANDYGILMDCGEGTYSQLLNHYGTKLGRKLIMNLKIIFISHIHADHHLGILQLLKEREVIYKEENKPHEPVYLIIPFNMIPWLDRYTKLIDHLDYYLVFNQYIDSNAERMDIHKMKLQKTDKVMQSYNTKGLLFNNEVLINETSKKDVKSDKKKEENKISDMLNSDEIELDAYEDPHMSSILKQYNEIAINNQKHMDQFLQESMHIKSIKAIEVDHCPQAFGMMIEHCSGWRIVYSGDTRLSKNLIDECHGSTILIHESTFQMGMDKDANSKAHSTLEHAIKCGISMGAWRTIATHFSQRYSKGYDSSNLKMEKIPELEKLNFYRKNNLVLGFDHLRFKLGDLYNLPYKSQKIGHLISELLKEAQAKIQFL